MSVLQLSTASVDKLFLEFIKPGMDKMFVKNTVVYDRFKTNTENCLGKYGVQKLQTKGSKSARPSSTSTFPTALQGTFDEFIFYMKRGMYASLQFDGLALACGKGAGAVKDLVKTEVEGQLVFISNSLNRTFWGDGSGRLAQLDAASSNSTTVTIDHPYFGKDSSYYTTAHNYLEVDVPVDIYDTSGTLEASNVAISSLTDDADGTSTLVMASAVTASNNSWIFLHDTYAASEAAGTGVPMGLYGIVSASNQTVGITATSAFQNINRSTYDYVCAQVFNMDPAAGTTLTVPTNKKILECIQKLEKYGSVDVMLTNGAIWRALYVILEADKTMPNPSDKAYWGGTSGITFYGGRQRAIPIVWDDDAPDSRIFFLDSSKIKVIAPNKSGMEWLPGDSGHILNRVQGKDEYAANMRWYYNMTVSNPKAEGVLTYVKHNES